VNRRPPASWRLASALLRHQTTASGRRPAARAALSRATCWSMASRAGALPGGGAPSRCAGEQACGHPAAGRLAGRVWRRRANCWYWAAAAPACAQTVELGRGGGTFEVDGGGRTVFASATPLGNVTAGAGPLFSVELQHVRPDEEEEMNRNGAVLLVVAALVGRTSRSSCKGRHYVVGFGPAPRPSPRTARKFRTKPNLGGPQSSRCRANVLTIETPGVKGGEPQRSTVRITPATKLEYRDAKHR